MCFKLISISYKRHEYYSQFCETIRGQKNEKIKQNFILQANTVFYVIISINVDTKYWQLFPRPDENNHWLVIMIVPFRYVNYDITYDWMEKVTIRSSILSLSRLLQQWSAVQTIRPIAPPKFIFVYILVLSFRKF